LEIRQPNPQDLEAVKRLWSSCFEKEEEPFFQWFFSNRYRAENALGAFDDGRLLAALHIAPYTVRLRGSDMSAGYLMGVGTFARYRQRGCMTALLTAVLAEMRRRGEWISILLPRLPSIYTRHGWEICYHTFKYSLQTKDLKTAEKVNGWRQAQFPGDMLLLDSIYRQYMQPYHAYVLRDIENWQGLLTENHGEGGQVYLLEICGVAYGYVICIFSGDILLIKEMAYISGEAREQVLSFIGLQAHSASKVEWNLPMGDPAYLHFTDERSGIILYPFTSGRIVDVVQALSLYKPPVGMIYIGFTEV